MINFVDVMNLDQGIIHIEQLYPIILLLDKEKRNQNGVNKKRNGLSVFDYKDMVTKKLCNSFNCGLDHGFHMTVMNIAKIFYHTSFYIWSMYF